MSFVSPEGIFEVPGSRAGLPAWAYHHAELTELEIDRIFLQNWLFVAHISQIPVAGDYRCLDVSDEHAFVIRDEAGKVHAFRNSCRHRGVRVVANQSGHCEQAMTCPFHGWSYHLDGRLKNIPRADSFAGLDLATLGLKPLDCEIWHGLIFIRFGGEGPSMVDLMADAEDEIGPYRIEEMQLLGEPYDYQFELDWKAVVDVDNEGYHVPVGHPELFDLVGSSYIDQPLASGLNRSSGSFKNRKHKLERVRDYVAALPEESYLPESHRHQWIYWGLYPTFVLTLFPDQIEAYQFLPRGPQQSTLTSVGFAIEDQRPQMQAARQLNQAINATVGTEDFQLIEAVSESMRSRAFEGLNLSDREVGVAAMHNKLRKVLPVLTLEQAPSAGTLAEVNAVMLQQQSVAP